MRPTFLDHVWQQDTARLIFCKAVNEISWATEVTEIIEGLKNGSLSVLGALCVLCG
jgi:hypothetical protein